MSQDNKKRRLKEHSLIANEVATATRKFRALHETGVGLSDFFTIWPALYEELCESGKNSLYDVVHSAFKKESSELESLFWTQLTARFRGTDEDGVKFTKGDDDYNAAKTLGVRAAYFKFTRVDNIDILGREFDDDEGDDLEFNYDAFLQRIFMIVPFAPELTDTVNNFVAMLKEHQEVTNDIETDEFRANDERESKKKKKRNRTGETKETDFNAERLKVIRDAITEYVHEFVETIRGSPLFNIDIDKAKRDAKEKDKKERGDKDKEKEKESDH